MPTKIYITFIVLLFLHVRASAADFESTYYNIHTDIPRAAAKEAYVRLDRMYEEMSRFFVDVPLKGEGKLHAVLFSNRRDYLRAGGLSFADGCYKRNDKALLVCFTMTSVWHGVQHEATHQFAHEKLGAKFPVWFNEGIACYFGDAIYTGDSYLLGSRNEAELIRLEIERNNKMFLMNWPRLFAMDQTEWNRIYRGELYDEAWSITHFLMESGEARRKLTMEFIGKACQSETAWRDVFGDNNEKLGNEWLAFWKTAKNNEVECVRKRILLVLLSGFARVRSPEGKYLPDLESYFRAAEKNQIRFIDSPTFWFPETLLRAAVTERDKSAKWTLSFDAEQRPQILAEFNDGTKYQSSYTKGVQLDRTIVVEKSNSTKK
jgi:hypothetical protein